MTVFLRTGLFISGQRLLSARADYKNGMSAGERIIEIKVTKITLYMPNFIITLVY